MECSSLSKFDLLFNYALHIEIFSEVSTPSEVLFLMMNCYVSPAWFDSLLLRVKEILPLMQLGDLVSLMRLLAERKKFDISILPLIAAALTADPSQLSVLFLMNNCSLILACVKTKGFSFR